MKRILLGATLAFGAPLWAQNALDFTQNFGDWTPQNANLAREDVQNGQNGFLRLDAKAGDMARLSSPRLKLGENRWLQIGFRFRGEFPDSKRDWGGWIYVPFLNEKGDLVGSGAFPLASSAAWNTQNLELQAPEGATQYQVQLRLQNTGGRLDFDDVRIEATPESKAKIAAQTDEELAGLREVARLDLRENGGKWVLSGAGRELPNLAPASARPDGEKPALAFQLPEEWCENPDLVYEAQMRFKPRWSSATETLPHALWAMGRNIHDVKPNSVSGMLWQGQTFIARLTSENVGAKAEHYSQNIGVQSGQSYEAKARWSQNSLSSWWNGERAGGQEMTTPFRWPKDRLLWVGREDENLALLGGEIESFTLTILQPRARVAWRDAQSTGFFFAGAQKSAPQMAIEFPDRDGLKHPSRWAIWDWNGQKVRENLAPTHQNASAHSLQIPHLPLGWYELEATFGNEKSGFWKRRRAFALMPPVVAREAATSSPFGISEEFPLDADRYNPRTVETVFARAAQSGMRWWRVWLEWNHLEKEAGKRDFAALDHLVDCARRNGLELYVCLQGGNLAWQQTPVPADLPYRLMNQVSAGPRDWEQWERYIEAVASRYKGRISHWQIWNEPDARNALYPFQTEFYVEMLRRSSTVLRRVDPKNRVALGGFAGAWTNERRNLVSHTAKDAAWGLQGFYNLQPQGFYDIFDCHFYSVHEPNQSWDGIRESAATLRPFLDARGDNRKPIWNSETSMLSGRGAQIGQKGGWANVPLVSERVQALELVKLHVQSLAVGVQKTFWYGWGIRGSQGIVSGDFAPKPAYAAHLNLARELGGLRFQKALETGPARAYQFAGEKRFVSVAWTTGAPQTLRVGAAKSLSPRQIALQNPPKIEVVDAMGNRRALQKDSIALSDAPVYLVSDSPFSVADESLD